MKRIAGIVMTAMLLVILSVTSVFAAADFELVDSSPAAGYEKVQAQNVMVKLFFSEEVSAEATQAANKTMFTVKDEKGKAVPFSIYYDEKNPNSVNLMLEETLAEETQYKVTVSGAMVSNDGDTLGKDTVVDFKTYAPNNTGYVILMVAMIAVMMFMTMRDQKKAIDAENAVKKDAAAGIQTNPYKLAKEKKISVAEAQKIIDQEKAKAEKKAAKNKKPVKEEKSAEPEKKVYKVKTKRVTKMHK